jgi:sRNA-binding protein
LGWERGAAEVAGEEEGTKLKLRMLETEMPDQYQHHDTIIAKLARLFPKAFFEDPKKRVPLKHGIVGEVEQQGCNELIGVDVGAAIAWYMSNLGYQICLANAAGKQRVDLNGELGSKVTPQEARDAQQEVTRIRADMKQKAANPMSVVAYLGDDLMQKVEAAPVNTPKPRLELPSKPRLELPPNPRLGLSLSELIDSVEKKLKRVTSLHDSENDEFKEVFLQTVLKELKADVEAMQAQVK